MAEIRELIEKYALENASKHNGAPRASSIMKMLFGNNPELCHRASELLPIIEEALAEMAKTHSAIEGEKLVEIAPKPLKNLRERKEPKKGLPDLGGAEKGVVMRFAPNPNGPPTIGSARGIVIISEYVKRYGGKFILRFDDTDPMKKKPLLDAYNWYVEDCKWLDAKPDLIITASERIDLYYPVATDLILRGGAYVCLCDQGTFKFHKDKGIPCRHRDQLPEENLDLWNLMLSGHLKEGEAVLRIKTDMSHKNPAIRDWPAARPVETPHPLVGRRYRVWPLLDFESAIEDHLQKITHILRGKDLADSKERQLYLYKYMGWEYPQVILWGKIKDLGWIESLAVHKGEKEIKVKFGSFSTSMLKKAIAVGLYDGWNDPRVPTVRALRDRGIRPEALRKFFIDLGISETDICMNMDSIYAENRKLIDSVANRYFFVKDPIRLEIEGDVPSKAIAPLHPTIDRGYREIHTSNKLFLCKKDLANLEPGDRIRLKHFCNIEFLSVKPLKVLFAGTEVVRKMPIIHWAPEDGIPITVIRPDGIDQGLGEAGIAEELGKLVQFERYGFVRIKRIGDPIMAYYTHR